MKQHWEEELAKLRTEYREALVSKRDFENEMAARRVFDELKEQSLKGQAEKLAFQSQTDRRRFLSKAYKEHAEFLLQQQRKELMRKRSSELDMHRQQQKEMKEIIERQNLYIQSLKEKAAKTNSYSNPKTSNRKLNLPKDITPVPEEKGYEYWNRLGDVVTAQARGLVQSSLAPELLSPASESYVAPSTGVQFGTHPEERTIRAEETEKEKDGESGGGVEEISVRYSNDIKGHDQAQAQGALHHPETITKSSSSISTSPKHVRSVALRLPSEETNQSELDNTDVFQETMDMGIEKHEKGVQERERESESQEGKPEMSKAGSEGLESPYASELDSQKFSHLKSVLKSPKSPSKGISVSWSDNVSDLARPSTASTGRVSALSSVRSSDVPTNLTDDLKIPSKLPRRLSLVQEERPSQIEPYEAANANKSTTLFRKAETLEVSDWSGAENSTPKAAKSDVSFDINEVEKRWSIGSGAAVSETRNGTEDDAPLTTSNLTLRESVNALPNIQPEENESVPSHGGDSKSSRSKESIEENLGGGLGGFLSFSRKKKSLPPQTHSVVLNQKPEEKKNVTPKFDSNAGFEFDEKEGLKIDEKENDVPDTDLDNYQLPSKPSSSRKKRSSNLILSSKSGGSFGGASFGSALRKLDLGLEDDFPDEEGDSEYNASMEVAQTANDDDEFEDF
eukprot:CAMPEP_0197521720 /NCGR_PEP_ID=MMETSP1318-20131121/6963_1 /TAXON_ID=552666 /ORGANISM="Partenskyella glossopodia, Strain RCC365" /LENGTH=679 /DNA_ID=CAMNT_0043073825 /DNA_START=1 /DNA_END=2040 /DNA_ORIENTATION=+